VPKYATKIIKMHLTIIKILNFINCFLLHLKIDATNYSHRRCHQCTLYNENGSVVLDFNRKFMMCKVF